MRNLAMRLASVLPGPKITCNFCGMAFRRFGRNHSEGLACVRCGSIARERVTYAAILNEFAADPDSMILNNSELQDLRVLEFSPRSHLIRRSLYSKTFAEYVASDFDVAHHGGDIELDLTDLTSLQNYVGHFDVVICAHVLEHIQEYKSAIANLSRLLAPTGKVFFQVPILESEYTKITWDEFHGDHTRAYHRFGFDVVDDLIPSFSSIKVYVGLKKFPVILDEVSVNKYDYLWASKLKFEIKEFGAEALRSKGLGCPELCEVIVLGDAVQA
jgi:SAM-dependent methyltransferase